MRSQINVGHDSQLQNLSYIFSFGMALIVIEKLNESKLLPKFVF